MIEQDQENASDEGDWNTVPLFQGVRYTIRVAGGPDRVHEALYLGNLRPQMGDEWLVLSGVLQGAMFWPRDVEVVAPMEGEVGRLLDAAQYMTSQGYV